MQVIRTQQPFPLVDDIFRYWHGKGYNADFLELCLASPIALLLREAFEKQLLDAQARTGQLPGL